MSARNYFALILIFAFVSFACLASLNVQLSRAEALTNTSAPAAAIDTSEHGFDVSNMDTSVSACANFFQYANGGWIAKNPIPPSFSRWGTFSQLAERNNAHVREILEDGARKKAPAGSNDQKMADYYSSCMDEASIEAAGLKPIEAELNRINTIKDQLALELEIARLHSRGVPVLFRFAAAQDQKDSTAVIAQIFQGGLSLADRDYYLKDDPDAKRIREKFLAHVVKMFQLAGDDEATSTANAGTVMTLETRLAGFSMTREQLRDPDSRYHKVSLAELKKTVPDFDWDAYLKNVGVTNIVNLNLGMPDFMTRATDDLRTIAVPGWRTYLRWQLLNAAAPTLTKAFVDEDFEFKGRVLTGTTEQQPRWKRCVAATDQALGDAVGREYVKRHFSAEARAHAAQMIQNLVAALRDDLTTLPWMGDVTRQRAAAKLNAFAKKIGYPDKWRDYARLKVGRISYAENTEASRLFQFNRNLEKIGKPVDRTEWGMTPPTVNASYNSSLNDITFPAGILQPPFYDPNVDDAINYGGIGAVIGHEMTHGFDDSGAKFDALGNRTNWWTDDDLKNFNSRTQCVADQFDGYEAQPGIFQKGRRVLGESIADLGGLAVAYAALQKALTGKPRPANIDGFTPEQRFFLGWAQVWAESARPEFERQQIITNPHPLARFRVNGPLSNMPTFAAAYQCKAGDQMVRPPEKRCQIW